MCKQLKIHRLRSEHSESSFALDVLCSRARSRSVVFEQAEVGHQRGRHGPAELGWLSSRSLGAHGAPPEKVTATSLIVDSALSLAVTSATVSSKRMYAVG